jgi:hypothetical protein
MDRLRCGARVRRVLLVVGLAFAGLPVGSALAATTVGQTGTPVDSRQVLMTGGIERAETGSVMPGAGTVTSFQFQAGSCTAAAGSFDFQVLRPVGVDQYQVIGNTGTQSNPCDGMLHSYPVDIAVQAGDILGVYVVSDWEGVIDVAAPESFAVMAQPQVNDITVKLRPISFNDSSADESATFVPSPMPGPMPGPTPGPGKNTPSGSGPSANPSLQVPNGSPHGCGNGRGWKIGTEARC